MPNPFHLSQTTASELIQTRRCRRKNAGKRRYRMALAVELIQDFYLALRGARRKGLDIGTYLLTPAEWQMNNAEGRNSVHVEDYSQVEHKNVCGYVIASVGSTLHEMITPRVRCRTYTVG